MEHPEGLERYKLFAQFLLEGQVILLLKRCCPRVRMSLFSLVVRFLNTSGLQSKSDISFSNSFL